MTGHWFRLKTKPFKTKTECLIKKIRSFPQTLFWYGFGCGFWPILSRKATTMRPFGALLQFQFCHYCLILDTACKVHDFLKALLEASKDFSRMCKAFIYTYTIRTSISFIHIYTYLYCLHKYSLYIHIIYILYTLPLHLLPTSPPLYEFFAPGQHGVPKLWRGWRNTRPQWQHRQRKNQFDSRGIDGLQEQPEQFRFWHLAVTEISESQLYPKLNVELAIKSTQKMGCFRLSFHLLVPCLISVMARKDCQDTVCMEAQDQISKGPF